MKKLLPILVCVLILSGGRGLAAEELGWRIASTSADLFVARPFTFALSVVGSALWVATLPITAPTRTSKDALDVMVKTPWQLTVDRPLGEFAE